jgi:uncharacterized protein YprB with RNaseH-like and TPR domain
MPNTAHFWTQEELADLGLPFGQFNERHPGITYHGWRHKRRDVAQMQADSEPMPVEGATIGEFVGFETIFWDLETTGLTAIMGRLLACAVADSWGKTQVFRIEDFPGATLIDDGPLAVAIRDYLEDADHWVTWNGKLYDIPFLNARLLKAGERPIRSDIKHTDLMYYSRGSFVRIGSSKLDNVSKFVDSPNRKTPLEWETWQLAGLGDKAAMDLVCEHAVADVLVTRDVFAHLKPHIRNVHR